MNRSFRCGMRPRSNVRRSHCFGEMRSVLFSLRLTVRGCDKGRWRRVPTQQRQLR